MMWAVAILTMVVGAVLAITQTDVKRMLAYSSIAHAGFILTGVLAIGPPASRPRCSTWSRTASPRSAPSPW
jgi:NADH-quinone oxidoreductase subunit N